MNQQEVAKLAGAWAAYAAYYRSTLPDEVLRMYAEDLADLDLESVKAAMDQYRKDPKNKFMPMPSQIREILEPQMDPESQARELAAKIGGAITKYGWCNAPEAREYIGEVGWGIIETRGGWMHICQNHGVTIDPTVFEAQVREQAKSEIKHGNRRIPFTTALTSGAARGKMQSIGEIMGVENALVVRDENDGERSR